MRRAKRQSVALASVLVLIAGGLMCLEMPGSTHVDATPDGLAIRPPRWLASLAQVRISAMSNGNFDTAELPLNKPTGHQTGGATAVVDSANARLLGTTSNADSAVSYFG